MQENAYEDVQEDRGTWMLLSKGGDDAYFKQDPDNPDNPKVRYPFLYAQSKEFLFQMRDVVYKHDARLTVKEWNEHFRTEGLAVESPWLDD